MNNKNYDYLNNIMYKTTVQTINLTHRNHSVQITYLWADYSNFIVAS